MRCAMSSRVEDEEAAAGQPERERKRWGIGLAVIGYLFAFLLVGIVVGVYATAAELESGERTLGLILANFAGLWTGMGLTVLYATRLQPGGTLRSEFGLAFEPVDIAIGAVAGLGTQFLVLPLVYLPWYLFSDGFSERLEEPAERLTEVTDGGGYLLLAVLVTIGAPLVEELFFRGLVQRSLLRRLRPVAAIGLTALLFGLAHFDPITVPGLTVFGLVVGYLAYRFGRLGPAIMAHVFFNLATVVVMA